MATLVRTILHGGLRFGLDRGLHGLGGNFYSSGCGCPRRFSRSGRAAAGGGLWGRGFGCGIRAWARWRDRPRRVTFLSIFRLGGNFPSIATGCACPSRFSRGGRAATGGGFWGRGFWLGIRACGRWCDSPRRGSPRRGTFLGIFRLRRNGRQALGQDIDGARYARLVGLGLSFINLRYNEHFFQLAEIGRGTHANVEKELTAQRHLRHPAHQQALGENAISAAGQNHFSGGHGFVAHHFFDHHFTRRRAAQYALQPRFVEERAHSTGLVVDQEHQRSGAVHVQHLAHDAVRGNDRHVALDAVVVTLVDVDRARQLGATRSDDLRRHSLGDELFFETKQRL